MKEETVDIISEIKLAYASMSDVERSVANYILTQPSVFINRTTRALASELGVSEGSIVNFANRVGAGGFTQLKLKVAMTLRPETAEDEAPDDGKAGALGVFQRTMRNAVQSFQDTSSTLTDELLGAVADVLLSAKGHIEVYGVGSSSMVATDAYYRLMRIGLPVYAVTDPHISSVSAAFLTPGCVAIAVSYTGKTVETLRAVEIAKRQGATIIALTSYAHSPLAQMADHMLVAVAKEAERYEEAVASRLTQILIMDSLCAYIEQQRPDSLLIRTNVTDIIGEHRM